MNRDVLLKHRPVGEPSASDFETAEAAIGEPHPGEVFLWNRYLSSDDAIRVWMLDQPPAHLLRLSRAEPEV